jgi:hypothetical protein
VNFRPFNEARDYVRTLELHNQSEWSNYRKSGNKPPDIPSNPNIKDKWKGWGDWIGNEYRSFEEARKYAHSFGLRSREEWKKWCKSGKNPEDIPVAPNEVYSHEWIIWGIGFRQSEAIVSKIMDNDCMSCFEALNPLEKSRWGFGGRCN